MINDKLKSSWNGGLKAFMTFIKVALVLAVTVYLVAGAMLFYSLKVGAGRNYTAIVDKQNESITQLQTAASNCQKVAGALIKDLRVLKMQKIDDVVNKYAPPQ